MARKRSPDRRLYDELTAAVDAQRAVVAASRIDAYHHLARQVENVSRTIMPSAALLDDYLRERVNALPNPQD